MTLEQALAELQYPDPQARVRAVRWLRVLGGERAVAALIGALDDPNGAVAARAMMGLGQMQAREVVPTLIERVLSDRWGIWRTPYIKVLGDLGDARALPTLMAALDDPDWQNVMAAFYALGMIRDRRSLSVLIAALDDPEERIVKAACGALSSFGDPEAVGPLLRLLDDPRWRVREAACEALERLKVTDDRLSAALEELPQDGEQDPPAPQICDLILGGPEAVPGLVNALEGPAADVRWQVALALGQRRAPEAAPALIRHLLRDESADVRVMCAWQLAHFPGEHVSEALRQALDEPDPGAIVVHHLSTVIGDRGDRQAVPLLLPLLSHPDRRNRLSAAKALLKLKAADERLVRALEKLARDPEAEEHDLEALEFNCVLGWRRRMATETGEPEPQPQMTMAELVEQARQILTEFEP